MDDKSSTNPRTITATAILAAIASVLMYLDFSLPFFPSFLTFDFSDLPALIASFAYGPFYGVAIDLIKSLLHLVRTHTGGIGELARFISGICLVIPSGIIYARNRTRRRAVVGMAAGLAVMTVISATVNTFVLVPFYTNIMPTEAIIAMITEIIPAADTLAELIAFGIVPYNIFKGIIVCLLSYVLYKRLSRILHDR
ncbi:MAG: ECF transporter S component [Oscillospiraceae bacterium]|jgi:riboflavin transporter FmnP|nr:ECF transporter S component [Oscillospiraceae bacterium]